MANHKAVEFANSRAALDFVLSQLGNSIRLAAPLALGKPNHLLNQIYERVRDNPSLDLTIYTALSLNPPGAGSGLRRRFFEPFRDRQWGKNYPALLYAEAAKRDALPPNIRVREFYFGAGSALSSLTLQCEYQSINYTHVAQSIYDANVGAIFQIVACREVGGKKAYSLSCNPDLTLDVVDLYKRNARPLLVVGVVHPGLPFLAGEAEVGEDFFDVLVRDSAEPHELFALPQVPISGADHAIGFYASQLIKDDGTLQIGIGSLSEAVTSALIFRQRQPQIYQKLVETFWGKRRKPSHLLHLGPFVRGLYGLSEMVSDGFMYLRQAGILNREVVDQKSGTKTYLHGAFYLGSKKFYEWLRKLSGEEFHGLRMGRVSKVNDLYDPNEVLLRRQRKNPRFLNTTMQVTLLGGAASETLTDGRVVSGVGGQYNFISMSHELEDSRSILMLRSTRMVKGKRCSNIVWSHGHLTIPRHLRDVVITEYGIADLRSRTDEETIIALLEIADSQFQPGLIEIAKRNRKLRPSFQLPDWARDNTPRRVQAALNEGKKAGTFAAYPFGSDFTPEEERIAFALKRLQALAADHSLIGRVRLLRRLMQSFQTDASIFRKELERMGLREPKGFRANVDQRMLLLGLSQLEK